MQKGFWLSRGAPDSAMHGPNAEQFRCVGARWNASLLHRW